jgi:hypothetical protein
MKIALCFRGIARSLKHTISSIRSNIIDPAKRIAEVRVFTHLFDQADIDNPRSNERGPLDRREHLLLQSDELYLEEPGQCLALHDFDRLKEYGDPWSNDFTSLRNLVHELHSLRQGWTMAERWKPDVIMFLRPDLLYESSFEVLLNKIQSNQRKGLCIPVWQGCWGANDRFAVATSLEAARTYALRISYIHDYCAGRNRPLHAEKFLLHRLRQEKTPVWFTNIRARRVRSNGAYAPEKFSVVKGSNLPAWFHSLSTGFAKI